MKRGAKDYTGQKFGRLFLIQRLSKEESGLNKTAYQCICDCGTSLLVRGNNLVSGTTKSCGCLEKEILRSSRKSKDYTGHKFNRLLALQRIMLPERGVSYLCQCDCGKQITVLGTSLTSNNTKSCGCLNREKIIERNHDPELIQKRTTNCSNVHNEIHWRTGEILKCKGKWERNVVRYMNALQIDFVWQIPFTLSDGRTYIIDLLDRSRNVYVEIKGWWRDDAKDKYDLFCSDFSDLKSEIWDQEKLSNLGIPIR